MSSVSELLGFEDQQTSDNDIELCYSDSGGDNDNDCTTNDEASANDSGSDVDNQVPNNNVHDNAGGEAGGNVHDDAGDEAGGECGSESSSIPDVMSQRDWRQKFIKRNALYRRIKIRYCNVAYIKPRCAIPATGKPVLYVCDGAENWTGPPNLLCAGQVLTVENIDWVIVAVLWVGCISKKVGDRVQYSCAGKSMRVLVCPLQAFDDAEADLSLSENKLR